MVEFSRRGDREQIVGPFRSYEWLGEGGFGPVWACRRKDGTGEPVAVKVASRKVADLADFSRRFNREVKVIDRVKSDYVPKLVDKQPGGTRPWLATELVPGLPLNKVVDSYNSLPDEVVWRLGSGIADALAAIHTAGITHRDLKPQNVLLVSDGPRVIDFNLAHIVGEAHKYDSTTLQRGYYGFSAPEEANGGLAKLGEHADIYSLGATLLFAATAHAPNEASTLEELAVAKPNLDGLSEENPLRELVASCLAHEPGDRPKLKELQRRIADHIESTGGVGFADFLPAQVKTRLKARREELARILGVRGPARLGWDEPEPSGPRNRTEAGTRPQADLGWSQTTSPARTPAPIPIPPAGGWTRRLAGWIRGPVAVHGDRLVVTCLDGTVTVLGTADGEAPAAWREPMNLGTTLHAGALVIMKGGTGIAYAGGADGRLHAIDLLSRRVQVIAETGSALVGTPVVARNRVYALSKDGRLHWASRDVAGTGVLCQLDGPATGALSEARGTIFAADMNGVVYAIGAADGRERWRLPTGGLVVSAPLPVGGWVYVADTDGMLREANIRDGSQRPPTKVETAVHTPPVHDAGRLYVGTSDGTVRGYQHGPDGLGPFWEMSADAEIAGLAAAGERVYVAAGDQLLEIDGATGDRGDVFDMGFPIGVPPVIYGRRGYIAGMGGDVTCLPLR